MLLFFISYVTLAQEKLIKGKVVAQGNDVSGINLVNLVNEKSAVTDENGAFSILAKEEDMLVFSDESFYYKRKIIEAEDLKKELLIIQMEPKPIELEEVIVTQYAHLTAYNLGIIDYIPKQYTVAERRMISKVGPAKVRKAMLENEKKQAVVTIVENFIDDDYFINTLKIDPDYIKGFKLYFSEDKDFAKVVNSKVKDEITLAIIEIAQKYNALQTEEITTD